MSSRLRIGVAAALLALGGLACLTPSVPLPPPLLSSLSFQRSADVVGAVIIQGMATPRHANVRFYIFNRSRNDGVIAGAAADGSFTSGPFAGADGDNVQLYFDTASGERSQTLCTTLSLSGPLSSTGCL
jgi:hypothetical protein